jgi:hypothetical protein
MKYELKIHNYTVCGRWRSRFKWSTKDEEVTCRICLTGGMSQFKNSTKKKLMNKDTKKPHFILKDDSKLYWIENMPEEPSYYERSNSIYADKNLIHKDRYQRAIQSAIDNAVEVSNHIEVHAAILSKYQEAKIGKVYSLNCRVEKLPNVEEVKSDYLKFGLRSEVKLLVHVTFDEQPEKKALHNKLIEDTVNNDDAAMFASDEEKLAYQHFVWRGMQLRDEQPEKKDNKQSYRWVKATEQLPPHMIVQFIRVDGLKYTAYYDYSLKKFFQKVGDRGFDAESVEWLVEEESKSFKAAYVGRPVYENGLEPEKSDVEVWEEVLLNYDRQRMMRRGLKELAKEISEKYTITPKQ